MLYVQRLCKLNEKVRKIVDNCNYWSREETTNCVKIPAIKDQSMGRNSTSSIVRFRVVSHYTKQKVQNVE